MAQDGGTRDVTFLSELIAAEKAGSGLRHAVVCPNVTGRTKERIVLIHIRKREGLRVLEI